MTSISQAQLEPKQLDRLAAQRQLYADAKTIQLWHIILSVPVVIAWSTLVALAPTLKVGAALWGIGLTIVDLVYLTPRKRDLKTKAAKIQELFDCYVLQLPWHNLKAGRQPDPEIIAGAAARYKKQDPEFKTVKNWYSSAADRVPVHVGRIVCQRANCRWDASLRRQYASGVWWALAGAAAIVVVISLFGGATLESFILATLIPLMPAFILGIREAKEHREAADRAERLKEACHDLWEKALSTSTVPTELLYASRQLQDEVFEHRCRSPLVFDRIYSRLRKEHEEEMNKAAETLVDEALTHDLTAN